MPPVYRRPVRRLRSYNGIGSFADPAQFQIAVNQITQAAGRLKEASKQETIANTFAEALDKVFKKTSIITVDDMLTGQINIDSTAPGTLIRTYNDGRASLRLRNMGSKNVYIGTQPPITTTNGWLMKPDEVITLTSSRGEVYGITAGTDTTIVAFLEE